MASATPATVVAATVVAVVVAAIVVVAVVASSLLLRQQADGNAKLQYISLSQPQQQITIQSSKSDQ